MQSDLQISSTEQGDVSIVKVGGYLDAHTASKLEEALAELIETEQYNLVINFADLAYISSAGLGVIMGFVEEFRNNSGDIKLSNMNEKIYRIFDLVGFPTLYQIFDDESEAVSAYANDGGAAEGS